MVESQHFLASFSEASNSLESNNSFTFQVDSVQPAYRKPDNYHFKTPEKAFRDIADCKQNKIEDFSHKKEKEATILHSDMNGMMTALYWSYTNHYPLKLSVSDFILMIGQGLSKHMEVHAEDLRKEFVDFEGKEKIIIETVDLIPGAENDWSTVFGQFTEEIKKRVKTDLYDVMIDDTSVATKLSKIASEIAIMDSFKHYFEYVVMCVCGIPKITLVGKKEDWKRLEAKVKKLKEMNANDRLKLDWWLDHLVPLVEKIVEQAISRKIDNDFWKEIYQYHEGQIYRKSPSITGWINIFNPYLASSKRLGSKDPFGDVIQCETVYVRNSFNSGESLKSKPKYGEMNPKSLINGTTRAPLKWICGDKEFNMTLYGGFLGAKMSDDLTIEPVYFYAVTYD